MGFILWGINKLVMDISKQITKGTLCNSYWRTDENGNGNLFFLDGVWYSSVIQYYYRHKFNYDQKHVEIIMNTHDVHKLISKYKSIRLSPIKYEEWKTFNLSILIRGMYSKFEQNVHFLKDLLAASESYLDTIKDGTFVHNNRFLLFEIDPSPCLKKVATAYKKQVPITLRNEESQMKPFLKEKLVEYTEWAIP